jgi:chemotaxis protein MotB
MAVREYTEQSYPEYSTKQPARAWPGWLAFVFAVALCGAFIWLRHRPIYQQNTALSEEVRTAQGSLAALIPKLEEAERKVLALEQERNGLSAQHSLLMAEKQAALDALQRLKDELSSKLVVEVQSGDITITRRGNELVVDVSDKILFDVGKTEIKERGQQILVQVASILAGFKDHIIQVGGHTDSARVVSPELVERYPTNWELSTARATNVVRFLQEHSTIPGDRLLAAGFAEFRPTASNRNEGGRQKNRRIEIVLLPRQQRS